jgi:hypothetical protein
MNCGTILRMDRLHPRIWQDASMPPAVGNCILRHIMHPRLMNPPYHLVECGRKVFQARLLIAWHIGGVKHPLDETPTIVRLDASNDAFVKGLSTAGNISRQEDELEVAQADEFQAVPLYNLSVCHHVGRGVVKDA